MRRQSVSFLTLALAASLTAGCAQQSARPTSEPTASGSRVTEIRYRVGPCHGTCPVYQIELDDAGTTRFVGEQFTAIEGERVRANDPERFTRVLDRLAAWQPAMGMTVETPTCGPRATDMSHYIVTWTNGDGEVAVLEHDSGCRSADARLLTERLRSLPQALGIEGWVGR